MTRSGYSVSIQAETRKKLERLLKKVKTSRAGIVSQLIENEYKKQI